MIEKQTKNKLECEKWRGGSIIFTPSHNGTPIKFLFSKQNKRKN